MASQLVQPLMVSQAHITVLATRHPTAGMAFYHRSKSPSVLKKDDLLFPFQSLPHLLQQHRRERTRHPLFTGQFLNVHHFDTGQTYLTVALCQLHQPVFPLKGIIISFNTWSSRPQQCFRPEQGGQYDGSIPRMIARSRILLFIGLFVFLIHDDQP